MPNLETDSRGRQWKTSKDKIECLADIMNAQSIHPLQTSDELFHIFDAALTGKEIDFLIDMGGGMYSRQRLMEKIGIAEDVFDAILDSLIYKGPVAVIRDADNNKCYHIMTIYPGWFEFYMMRGVDDAAHREFAHRIERMYTAAYEFGNEEVINELVKDVGPHLAVTPTVAPTARTINIGAELTHENHVYAAPSITALFESLADTEAVSVGHCLCRFEKELIGDHCRTQMPMETCISIGPAAEHLIEQGISRQISKEDAIEMVSQWQDMGCIHQTGRTIPLKDFKSQYPVDVICNCCWDCCGVIGNYNRGYLPLTVTSHYRAEVDGDTCTGCGDCIEYCPVGVLSLKDIATIEDKYCIGCGQCSHHCEQNAITLIKDLRVVFLPMLGHDDARIKPPAELLAQDDQKQELETISSARAETLAVLEQTRQKFMRPELRKVFKKWNKVMLYDFTDLDEAWHFVLTKGVPGPLVEGSVEKPDIHYILTGSVFVGLMQGTIDGFRAFRKKLVKVKAPVLDLIKLQKLIK